MNGFDTSVLHAINSHAGHTFLLDPIMKFFAQYSPELYAVMLLIGWFTLPRTEENRRHALVVSVAGGVIALLVNFAIGSIWFRPRPFVADPSQFHNIIPHAADTSFPSDHASGAFGFTVGAWGQSAKWYYRLSLVIAILVMIARVYTGVHWPTDVLAGMVVGLASGWIARRLSSPLRIVTNIGLRLFRMGHYQSR